MLKSNKDISKEVTQKPVYQLTFVCPNSILEKLEKGVKYFQAYFAPFSCDHDFTPFKYCSQ